MKGLRSNGILLLFLLQLGVPGWVILSHHRVLSGGAPRRFRIRSVDPQDPFRGRFLRLRFLDRRVPLSPGQDFEAGEEVFAILEEGEKGFTKPTEIRREAPGEGLWLPALISSVGSGFLELEFPMDRFYLEESLAREADRLLWRLAREEPDPHVLVRILEGRAVIEDLILGGKPVRQYIEDERKKRRR